MPVVETAVSLQQLNESDFHVLNVSLASDVELQIMVRKFEFEEGMKSFEFGCVDTPFSAVLQRRGLEAWAVDLRAYPYKEKVHKFIQGDIAAIDLPSEYFDVAVDISALHHAGVGYEKHGAAKFDDGDEMLSRKIWRTLKKDGFYYIVLDRIKREFMVHDAFVRQYNITSFVERICQDRWRVVDMDFFDVLGNQVTYGSQWLEIGYFKLLKIP